MVGIAANEFQVDGNVIGLEQQTGAADRQLADPAGAKATADDQAFRVAPILEAQEAADHLGELLGEVFDRTLHQCGSGRVAFLQQGGELLLADVFAKLVAERILAEFLQGLTPLVDDLPEGLFAAPVADEALFVFDFEIVAVDPDAGQHRGAVRRQLELVVALFSHAPRYPKRQLRLERGGSAGGSAPAKIANDDSTL